MKRASLQGRILRLCQKELRETLRDRRTIITLLMMPLLVYPLLSMALNRFLLSANVGEDQMTFTVGAASDGERNSFQMWLADPRSNPPEEIVAASGGEVAVPGCGSLTRLPLEDRDAPL